MVRSFGRPNLAEARAGSLGNTLRSQGFTLPVAYWITTPAALAGAGEGLREARGAGLQGRICDLVMDGGALPTPTADQVQLGEKLPNHRSWSSLSIGFPEVDSEPPMPGTRHAISTGTAGHDAIGSAMRQRRDERTQLCRMHR